jgi:hypothetical protein
MARSRITVGAADSLAQLAILEGFQIFLFPTVGETGEDRGATLIQSSLRNSRGCQETHHAEWTLLRGREYIGLGPPLALSSRPLIRAILSCKKAGKKSEAWQRDPKRREKSVTKCEGRRVPLCLD